MSWLNSIVQQHSEFESPISFYKWSALASISAVVKDNIYFDKFLYKVYPNIYVLLHADSGLKKSAPVAMARKLVRAVNDTIIISGRSSIQGILKKLSTAESMPGGVIRKAGKCFIVSSELSSSLVEDPVANKILTDLYDRNYNDDFDSLLKMEEFRLKDPTVTMLSATNEAQAETFFTRADIQGGLFARTFIIHEHQSSVINSLMFKPTVMPDYTESIRYLKELSKLRGQIEMDDETRHYFKDWYHNFRENIISQKVKDYTGTVNRFDDSVLKVAILTSLGHKPELRISLDTIKEAIIECEKLTGNVRRVTLSKGKNKFAEETSLVIEELMSREPHSITRMMLNRKYWMRANTDEWDNIMNSLEVAGIIRKETIGNNIVYEMPDEQVREWKKLLEGKNK